ncbi:hypothetical protein COT29_00160 [Candidatus Micrarchaeota archaeon CG08_land_8_20_14_0_20_59_11]|nr:MAG: hypothetical protein COT29_00160 [Candidatus Micrarchaeota archaeon CG08_land_8_20_14_0_20_59_11]
MVLQFVIGGALFLATGWAISLAFFREADVVERVVFSLACAMTVPAIILAFLNLILKIKLDAIVVYVVLIAVTAASFWYSKTQPQRHHVGKHS